MSEIILNDKGGLAGHFLLASPAMPDERFRGCAIYLTVHDEQGAMGFIMNKPLVDVRFSQILIELDMVKAEHEASLSPRVLNFPVYHGGYVDETRGFILHSEDETLKGMSEKFSNGLYVTTSLEALQLFSQGILPKHAKLMLGYVGWEKGQLEKELRLDGWVVVESDPEDLFSPPETLYAKLVARLGGLQGVLATQSGRA